MEGMPQNSTNEAKGNGCGTSKATLILVVIIVAFCFICFCYTCWEKYKNKISKGEQKCENEKVQSELEYQQSEIEKLKSEKEYQQSEIEKLKSEKEEFRVELGMRKAQYKFDWRKASIYADWRKEVFQAVTVTLDADTAHRALSLSQDGRCITWQEEDQDLPDTPQRFDSLPCVLGQLRITSGRCFWEVDIADTVSYDLGICRDNVTRKGRVPISPQNGFWVIRLYNKEYFALTSPEKSLTLREHPCRVGIFLDYGDGDVSFYNMTDGSHIYSFKRNTFQVAIRPFFRLWDSNSGSLAIVH